MKKLLMVPLIALMAGCAANMPAQPTTQKTMGAICATAGAAGQALSVSADKATNQKALPYLEALLAPCKTATPTAAATSAESEAFNKLMAIAAPYMG